MSQQLDLKAKGLFTNPNPIGGVPPGSLEVANNVVIDQDNVIENEIINKVKTHNRNLV